MQHYHLGEKKNTILCWIKNELYHRLCPPCLVEQPDDPKWMSGNIRKMARTRVLIFTRMNRCDQGLNQQSDLVAKNLKSKLWLETLQEKLY